MILEEVCNLNDCKRASFAAVSREWQVILERHNFSRIKLTPRRLRHFHSMVHRNRHHIRYLWFVFELQRYGCAECEAKDVEQLGLKAEDNNAITASLEELFHALSKFEPMGDLALDISVHSPSDSEHWFQGLTFGPDDSLSGFGTNRVAEPRAAYAIEEPHHQWSEHAPEETAILKVFQDVMGEGPFEDDPEEYQWWQQLPLVPAVTSIILRRQNRRRWKPNALRYMFARFPELEEIIYEPWREWERIIQGWTDDWYRILFEPLASSGIKRLTLFEDFNEQYSRRCKDRDPIRIPNIAVSETIAQASLTFEHLSVSFIADASQFFDACRISFKWPNLASLALTSQLLTPDEDPTSIYVMLQAAAAVALQMPQLRTMEIWNGREGSAGLFKYQFLERRRPAMVTWRGTWRLTLPPHLTSSWEALALKHQGSGCNVAEELLDVDIKCHGDAMYYLQLSKPVLRPASLRQIRVEHNC
ncbi:hypothetical protein F5Y16DRAFT_423516 [Xylariaceae sp. FL0255]|nr:hypothetical protein F5Y16DRAFT_423516 [Xylariaceae sp. FL0255]